MDVEADDDADDAKDAPDDAADTEVSVDEPDDDDTTDDAADTEESADEPDDEDTTDDADTPEASGDLHSGEYRWGGSALVSVVALVGVALLGWLVIHPDFSGPERAGDHTVLVRQSSGRSPATTASTAPAPTTTTTTPVDPFTKLPSGLSCSELRKWGGTYEDAVRYWNRTGQPEALDRDGNGAPCETTFSKEDVVAVLGTIPPEDGSTTTTSVPGSGRPAPPAVAGLPGGLNCGQLRAKGYGASDAVAYYLAEGRPGRMDADGNGIPCETVFSDAAAAWRRR